MNLDGYVPVVERLRRARADHPDLRVVELPHDVVTIGDRISILCRVEVRLDPSDPCPTIGSVLEPFPGSTPFTRGSELMVGYTSALGRALGYLGYGIEHGIASRDEVEARSGPTVPTVPARRSQRPTEPDPGPSVPAPSGPGRRRPPTVRMLELLRTMLDERGLVLDLAEDAEILADFDLCRAKLNELQTVEKLPKRATP